MDSEGPVARDIRARLQAAFAPVDLVIEDDPARHAGHPHEGGIDDRPGGETHINVRIVSEAFTGLSRLQRQRAVNACLAEALEHLAAAGRLSSTAPRDPLIELLYSLTAYQFQEYVTGSLERPEDLERRLDGLLRAALDPWCPAQAARPRRPRAIRPA